MERGIEGYSEGKNNIEAYTHTNIYIHMERERGRGRGRERGRRREREKLGWSAEKTTTGC